VSCAGFSDETEVDFRNCAHVLLLEDEAEVVGEERSQVGQEELEALEDVFL
jgi:hypothetical protein